MDKPWKVILAFTGIFLAGILVGSLVTLRWGKGVAQRQPMGDQFGPLMEQRLATQLDLTAEQQVKIKPIVDQAAEELHQLRRTTQQTSAAVLVRMHGEIAALLTPAQKIKLDEVVAKQRERWERLKRFGEERRRLRDKSPPQ